MAERGSARPGICHGASGLQSLWRFRALIEVPNRLEKCLFLVNVTLPSCAQRKKELCIPTWQREKSRGYAGGLMR